MSIVSFNIGGSFVAFAARGCLGTSIRLGVSWYQYLSWCGYWYSCSSSVSIRVRILSINIGEVVWLLLPGVALVLVFVLVWVLVLIWILVW